MLTTKLVHRGALPGDTRFSDEEEALRAASRGVPSTLKISELFTRISSSPSEVIASGILTAKSNLAKISKVLVAPGWRQQGFGSLIISDMEAFARERGIKKIKATTESYSASKLFEACGYKIQSQIDLEINLESTPDFQGGPQFEILYLKQLHPRIF